MAQAAGHTGSTRNAGRELRPLTAQSRPGRAEGQRLGEEPRLKCRRASSGRSSHPPATDGHQIGPWPAPGPGGRAEGSAVTHIEAADPPRGATGPDHLCQRPHLLHLRGHPAGVRQALFRKRGQWQGSPPAVPLSPGEARLGNGAFQRRQSPSQPACEI